MVILSRPRKELRTGLLLAFAAVSQVSASDGTPQLFSPSFSDSRQTRDESQTNLKQLGLVMKIWANESEGRVFPPLDSRPGHLMMKGDQVFPLYMYDVSFFVSPAHPRAKKLVEQAVRDPLSIVDDHSYWYLGYAIPNEETGLAFVEAYKSAIAAGKVPDRDLKDTRVGDIHRLREGVERYFISDINNPETAARAQSEIPVMIERPGLQQGGSSVLFMDGHTEFIEYPGRFPMTEKFVEALQSLDQLKKVTG